jgi:hypothetical protein
MPRSVEHAGCMPDNGNAEDDAPERTLPPQPLLALHLMLRARRACDVTLQTTGRSFAYSSGAVL